MSQRTTRFKTWWKQQRAAVLHGLSVTLLIGSVGLLLEDIGVALTQGCPPQTWCHVGFVLLFGPIALWAYYKKDSRMRRYGTMHYIRLLCAGMQDWHLKKVLDTERLDFKSATRWVDPLADSQDHRFIDIRDDVTAISAELERMLNEDTETTGTRLAPNLLAPAALAVGYDFCSPRDTIRFSEYNGTRREEDAFEFTYGELQEAAQKWDNAMAARGTQDDVTALAAPGATGVFTYRDFPASGDPIPRDKVRTVWLTIKLSDATKDPLEKTDNRCELAQSCDVKRVVGAIEDDKLIKVKAINSNRGGMREWPTATIDSTVPIPGPELAWLTARWIERTLRDFPHATVLLSLQLPKTVSLAAGHLLNPNTERQPRPGNPWGRLITIVYLEGEKQRNRIMWVRRDQIDPKRILTGEAFSSYIRATNPNA